MIHRYGIMKAVIKCLHLHSLMSQSNTNEDMVVKLYLYRCLTAYA